jgi:hypothetical protein
MAELESLQEKFGLKEKKALRDYVLWLETEEGKSFILEHAGGGSREMGNHWTCMEFKANIITLYATGVVTE